MTCAQALPLLSAYFDDELDVTQSLAIKDHIRACASCAATHQEHQALHSSLQHQSLAFTPPPKLEQRVRNALQSEVQPRAKTVFPWWRWASIPLAAVLASALSWSVANHRNATSAESLVLAELVSGHVRSLMVDHLVDVATSDQHTVRPWFNGKVDFAPPVADFTASGFPLVGGRVDYIGARPVAVLVYKRRQHVINVFIWPSPSPQMETHDMALQGYNLLRWSKSGLIFWAVSDVSNTDLVSLCGLLQETA